MLLIIFGIFLGLSQAGDQNAALELLQSWQTEAAKPYRADLTVKIEQERKKTQILQTVTGELVFKDAQHAEATLLAESQFPDRGPQMRSIKPVEAHMKQVMDGSIWWVHVKMEAQNFESVMHAELSGFEALLASDQSGLVGMSLPILVDPRVLVAVLANHELHLTSEAQARTIGTVPSQNLLRSFNLPPELENANFVMRFPANAYYPLQIEVNAGEKQLFALTIDNKRPLKTVPAFEFSAPEGVQVVDILYPFESIIRQQEGE